MTRSPTARPRSDEMQLIFGCVASPLRRRKLESSLRDAAIIRWFNSFVDLREALETEIQRVIVAVVDVTDPTGASAHGFARSLADHYPGIGVVVYRRMVAESEADVCQLGAAGVHDILLDGLTDEGFMARSIVLDACRRGAADLVMQELKKALPARLVPFADAVVRNPAKGSIAAINPFAGFRTTASAKGTRRAGRAFLSSCMTRSAAPRRHASRTIDRATKPSSVRPSSRMS